MATGSNIDCVTVFGGSGFLGREITRRLAAAGIAVRVAVRHPDRAGARDRRDQSGEVVPVYADVRDGTSVALAMDGTDAVINTVGLYTERGAETFEAVHETGARNVAHAAAKSQVSRLVHISGIGVDPDSESSYVRSRARGERLVMEVFPQATILRPGVMFGPDDSFLNSLARMVRRSPVLPLFGRGDTRLQPVFVGDVAGAALKALDDPAARGRTYELGGPRVYSYRGLLELVAAHTGKRRLMLPLPFAVWELAALLASIFPEPPLTRAQVTLMKRDNVVAKTAAALQDLGIEGTPIERIFGNGAI